MDNNFDSGLQHMPVTTGTAADFAMGVACDARSTGEKYKSSCLWIALDTQFDLLNGNIGRLTLPELKFQFFQPILCSYGRFVASDSVGNVVIEYGGFRNVDKWSEWGLYAPGGEISSDTRTTKPFSISVGSASQEVVSSISALLNKNNSCLVELSSGKTVSAVFDGCFYICEDDRSCGIKVESEDVVAIGNRVTVIGTLMTVSGERVLKDAIAKIVP